MALILNTKKYSICGNNKPNLGGSGLLDDPNQKSIEYLEDTLRLADRPIFCNRSPMSKGFKVLPHSFLNSHIWKSARLKYRAFIVELLSRCCWKKTDFVSNGHVIELLPGQFACSLRNMVKLFNPQDLKGPANADKYTKNDICGAIHYFSTLRVLGQELRHGITILTIIDPDIYDSNFNFNQTDNQTAFRQHSDSHLKQPVNQGTKEEKRRDIAQNSQGCPSIKVPSCQIYFSFESGKFEGITEEDLQDWKVAYPNADITKQLVLMVQWVKSNPTRSKNKKLWRKFITGWLMKADEKEMNRQAFSSQKTFGTPEVDRRRKNPDGTIANDKEYRF